MKQETYQYVLGVYDGSDGMRTSQLYSRLSALGPCGEIAVNLFRALKNSSRAKHYRGGIRGQGSYKSMAYNRKKYAIQNLCKILTENGAANGFVWGWAIDKNEQKHCWVLYVDTPNGQVSFHTDNREHGPDYPRDWDGIRGASVTRVCGYTAALLDAHAQTGRAA